MVCAAGWSGEPAHDAAGHRRPHAHANARATKDVARPGVAGVECAVVADGIVKQIVRTVGWICTAATRCIETETAADLPDDLAKLLRSDSQHFSVGQALRVCQVIDVQRGIV